MNRTILVYLLGCVLVFVDQTVLAPTLTSVMAAFHLQPGMAAWGFSTYTLVFAVGQPVLGHLADRTGRRSVFGFGVAAFGLGALVSGLAPVFAVFLAGRAIQALAAAAMVPTATTEVGYRSAPHQRGRALGLIGVALGVATVSGPNLAGLAVQFGAWRSIYLAGAPAAVLVLLLLLTATPAPPAVTPGSERQAGAMPGLAGLATPRMLVSAGAAFLIGFSVMASVFLPPFAQQVLGFTAAQAAYLLTPLSLAMAAASMLGGLVLDRMSPGRLLAVAAGLLTSYALVPATSGLFSLSGLMVLAGFGSGLGYGPVFSYIALQEANRAVASTAVALIAFTRSLGASLAPLVMAPFLAGATTRVAFSGVFGMAAGAAGLGLVATWALTRYDRSREGSLGAASTNR